MAQGQQFSEVILKYI